MFKAIGIQTPHPDYSKPRRQVFEEFTRAYIDNRQSLDILALSVRTDEAPEDDDDASLPSWVPLWTRTHLPKAWPVERTGMIYFSTEWPAASFNAARETKYRSDMATYEPGCLRVKGCRIGTINQRDAGPAFSGTDACPSFPFQEYITVFRRWCKIVRDVQSYPTGESTLDAFRRTVLFYNGDPESRAQEPAMAHVRYTPTEDSASFRRWHKLMLDPKGEIPVTSLHGGLETDTADDHAAISAHLARLDRNNQKNTLAPLDGLPVTHWGMSRLLQYAFFLLDSGYMGIGFHHCRQGDAVYILQGAHFPVVLRPSGASYRFVAAAYVHGVINGESWPDDEKTLEDLILE